jgi:heme A synthase
MRDTRARSLFRYTTFAALLVAIAQVTLGGIVRVTGSGDACPDWPLCYGQLIPPFEYHIVLEYSHRLSATLVGLIVLAVVILAWRHYRTNQVVFFASIGGGLLVIAAALLGGLTVLSELTWWIRLIHLSIAELVIASIAIAWLGSRGEVAVPKEALAYAPRHGRWVVWLAVGGVFVSILYGGYMVGVSYGSSCVTWPHCNGSMAPRGLPFEIHMGHRYLTVILGMIFASAAYISWRKGVVYPEIRGVIIFMLLMFGTQVIVGAFTVWTGFAIALKVAHLSLATLMWLSVVVLALMYCRPGRYGIKTIVGSTGH